MDKQRRSSSDQGTVIQSVVVRRMNRAFAPRRNPFALSSRAIASEPRDLRLLLGSLWR
jgi:hypothetical protein